MSQEAALFFTPRAQCPPRVPERQVPLTLQPERGAGPPWAGPRQPYGVAFTGTVSPRPLLLSHYSQVHEHTQTHTRTHKGPDGGIVKGGVGAAEQQHPVPCLHPPLPRGPWSASAARVMSGVVTCVLCARHRGGGGMTGWLQVGCVSVMNRCKRAQGRGEQPSLRGNR